MTATDSIAVDLWRVSGSLPPPSAGASLSQIERAFADRIDNKLQRRRYVRFHQGMRALISAYVGIRYVPFELGPWGKPHIVPESNPKDIRFNLSHSNDTCFVAITTGHDVGIDVEEIRDTSKYQTLLASDRSGFAKSLRDRTRKERDRLLLQGWARLEATNKALGIGISEESIRTLPRFLDGTFLTNFGNWTLHEPQIKDVAIAIMVRGAPSHLHFRGVV